jgi:PAS domain S-box-containing protein
MPTILVVDDRPENRSFLATLLGYKGHRLLEASDGEEALEVVRAERPDLIIADLLMPTMDGYEFVRRLRAETAVAHTPVVFFTAHYHEREAQALAHNCGVAHVLFKPADPQVVLRTVEGALGRAAPPPAAPPPDDFDREHLRLVTDKLSQKAAELHVTNRRLAALLDIALRLGSERDPHRLLEGFCQAARNLIGARYAAVGLVGGAGEHAQTLFTSGVEPQALAGVGFALPRGDVLDRLLAEARPVRLRDLGNGTPTPVFPPRLGIRSFLGAPVVSPGHAYGWACLADRLGADEFSEEDERLFAIFAALAGRVYENGRFYAEARQRTEELEREVAERRRAEEALRQSHALLRAVTEGTTDMVFVKDQQGCFLLINPAGARLLGKAVAEVLGKDDTALLSAEAAARVTADDRRVMAGGVTLTLEEVVEAAGARHTFLTTKGPYRDARGRVVGVVGISCDITERKKLEEQYRRAQKMEAVGRLAGGVAHDFNNLLTVILGYGDHLLATLPEGDPAREAVAQMTTAGARAASLTRQLLAFTRQQVIAPKVLDLKAVVADTQKLLQRVIGEDIELVTTAEPDLGSVRADPGQVVQVLMNLAVNARDAMPQGGKLTIAMQNVELDEEYAWSHPDARPGPHVLLAVSDTGSGMTAEVKARIFEPFFTTKEPGEGTGLGLATVYGIVKQAGASVDVDSAPGRGTMFRVYFARVDQSPSAGKSSPGLGPAPRGAETVLLVEDEDTVRSLARHLLAGCGYAVLEAQNGEEALRLAAGHAGRIDLLVTDVVMPQMGGRELAERLTASRPGLKVLFLSGYTNDAVMRHGVLEAEVEFLQKPFTPGAFAYKIREVLDAGG